MSSQYNEGSPQCPACHHAMSVDEMLAHDGDLFAIAPDEDTVKIVCPSCDVTYHCQGGYKPTYTTALDEDDLT